jgi:hypothetical protein
MRTQGTQGYVQDKNAMECSNIQIKGQANVASAGGNFVANAF